MATDRVGLKPRFRFSLRQLLIAVTAVAVLLGLWARFIRKELTIRAATAGEHSSSQYFGFALEDMKPRSILVASGTFTKDTWLSAYLYLVRSGTTQELNAFTVGRSPNQIGGFIWESLDITLALGDKETPSGRVTSLGSHGHSRGGGRGRGEVPYRINVIATQTFPGRLPPNRERIVYVEGDHQPVVTDDMTVADFASQNGGNYLVVVVELQ